MSGISRKLHVILLLFCTFSYDVSAALNLVKVYGASLLKAPIQTKCTSGVILAFAGDFCAQRAEIAKDFQRKSAENNGDNFRYDTELQCSKSRSNSSRESTVQPKAFRWQLLQNIDHRRSLSFAVFGGIISLAWHYMLPILAQWFPRSALTRLIIWQTTVIPFFYYPTFFFTTGIIRGIRVGNIWKNMRQIYFRTLIRNYCFWFPVQYLQFIYIPLEWQVLYVSLLGFVWNWVLSMKALQNKS